MRLIFIAAVIIVIESYKLLSDIMTIRLTLFYYFITPKIIINFYLSYHCFPENSLNLDDKMHRLFHYIIINYSTVTELWIAEKRQSKFRSYFK